MLVFHLKRFWPDEKDPQRVDLYEEIKSGRKTSEWRDHTPYWTNRLNIALTFPIIAFVVGYPKGNLPRLEATLLRITLHSETNQYEIRFGNVVEVTTLP